MTPIRKENAKSFRTGPPKKYSASTVEQNRASGQDRSRKRFVNSSIHNFRHRSQQSIAQATANAVENDNLIIDRKTGDR